MIKRKVYKYLLILIYFTASAVLSAQNNILYVKYRTDPAKPEINKISDEIASKIQAKIPSVVKIMGPLNYNANTDKSNTENFELINSSSIKYVLRLANVIKRGSVYELYFSFSYKHSNRLKEYTANCQELCPKI